VSDPNKNCRRANLQEAFTETFAVKPRLNALYPFSFSEKLQLKIHPPKVNLHKEL
jgi:hypothetical protein